MGISHYGGIKEQTTVNTPHPYDPRIHARGFSLVIAISVIALLSLLGFLVLEMVIEDVEMASAARHTDGALYIAESGLDWAIEQLTLAYPAATVFGDLTTSSLSLSDVVTINDPGCPNTACTVLQNPSGWRRLTPSGGLDYGGGSVYVYIRDDDDGDNNSDVDTNGNILIRAIARWPKNIGAYRAVEVTLRAGD